MNTSPMNVAMVGVDNFGHHRRGIMRRTGLFRIVAAYDHNPAALVKCCQEEPGCTAADSYDALIATPGIEAVFISTGGKYHAEQAVKALDRGLHVFVEKPLCSTPAEVDAIVAAAKRNNRRAGVGHNHHGEMALSRTLKRLIASGDLGRIVAVEKTTGHGGGFHIKPGDWRGDPEKNPGGMLFQCGVHGFHELMHLFGPIAEISARMRFDVNPDTGTADAACCLIKFADGMIGTLNAYHVIPYRHTTTIFGTKANIYIDGRYGNEGVKVLRQDRIANEYEPQVPVALDPGGDEDAGCLTSFYAGVRQGIPMYPDLIDGALAVAAVFAADVSVKRGGASVTIAEVCPGLGAGQAATKAR